ncbi:SCO3242 family prenyltransferase [Streptomyces sp. Da 82-17]|uniref:SCO3242 family prenyltransferase n=1 Tax=Streptomyces sp. Da 82-17 TaxID=3377116 RepID=UPI0038D4C152
MGTAGAASSSGGARRAPLGRARDWAELLRVSALFTVPGDALAGAAALGARPNRYTLAAIGCSLCLYEAGMALNDWADHAEDAVDRPHRPLPSGRIPPTAALAAAGALTAAGLALAARAGRPALTVASLLAGSVWAYDLKLKHTPAGPATMAAARGLDLLLGAVASGRGAGAEVRSVQRALPSSAVLAAHTFAVTTVSRREAQGGSTLVPLAALATTSVLGRIVATGSGSGSGAGSGAATAGAADGGAGGKGGVGGGGAGERGEALRVPSALGPPGPGALGLPGPGALGLPGPGVLGLPGPATLRLAPRHLLGAAYVATAARPLLHAALNPSPQLTQRAVGGGIRAMIPLQAALAARTGSLGTALATLSLAPIARRLGRKVSAT